MHDIGIEQEIEEGGKLKKRKRSRKRRKKGRQWGGYNDGGI